MNEKFCLTKLADQFLDEWEPVVCRFNDYDEAYIAGAYDFSDWLKQKLPFLTHVDHQSDEKTDDKSKSDSDHNDKGV